MFERNFCNISQNIDLYKCAWHKIVKSFKQKIIEEHEIFHLSWEIINVHIHDSNPHDIYRLQLQETKPILTHLS